MTDFRLKTPVRITVCGPSQVCEYSKLCFFSLTHRNYDFQIGKSFLVADLLKEQQKMFDKPFDKIIWCYGIEQPQFLRDIKKDIQKLETFSGFPEAEIEAGTLFKKGQHGCLVIGNEKWYYFLC